MFPVGELCYESVRSVEILTPAKVGLLCDVLGELNIYKVQDTSLGSYHYPGDDAQERSLSEGKGSAATNRSGDPTWLSLCANCDLLPDQRRHRRGSKTVWPFLPVLISKYICNAENLSASLSLFFKCDFNLGEKGRDIQK